MIDETLLGVELGCEYLVSFMSHKIDDIFHLHIRLSSYIKGHLRSRDVWSSVKNDALPNLTCSHRVEQDATMTTSYTLVGLKIN